MISRRTIIAATPWLAGLLPNSALGQPPAPAMPVPGVRPWSAQVPTIRIGLAGGENETDRLARYQGYQRLLEDTFKVPVRTYPAADYAGVMQAFGARQIEVAAIGPSAYAGAWLETNGNVEAVLVPIEEDGSTGYHSVLVTRADSGITSLEQMRGRSLAWADPNSASGYLIPRHELRQAGIDPEPGNYFGRTGFGGGHEQAVVAVVQRQYDAACTWGSGVGDPAEGYSRGNLHEMVAKGLLNMRDLRIIWMSRQIPASPLVVRKDTPEAFRNDIVAFHEALPIHYPVIYGQLVRGAGKGYKRVTHADFQLFVDLRRAEAEQRRRR